MSNLTVSDRISDVLLHGDLNSLTNKEKTQYAQKVCEAIGVNILTKPFGFHNLNGRLVMYANKSCADQLRKIHGVSITKIEKEVVGDIYTVTVYARDREGKEDSDTGAVDIKGLSGEKLANAMLKCITKAKRRVTLSICGLGMLDETEIEDIPREVKSADFNNDPFGKKEAALSVPDEMTPDNLPEDIAADSNDDLGAYVIKFGKKHSGKTLAEMDPFELDNYLQWLRSSSIQQNKELSGAALELLEMGEAFLKSKEFELNR